MPKGFKYPFQMTDRGPETAENAELVASALTILFAQEKGERPYQPLNGIELWPQVFENETALAEANVRREIALGISRNEPRVELLRTPVGTRELESGAREVDLVAVWRYNGRTYSSRREDARRYPSG